MPRNTADQAIITGVASVLNYGMTATSQSVIESVALQGGREGPDTAQRRMTQRGVILAGDVAAMGIGVAAQRFLAHRKDEPIARAWGRTFSWRLAVGGMAGAIIVTADMLFEGVGGDQRSWTRNAPIALPLGAGLAAWQYHRLRTKMVPRRASPMTPRVWLSTTPRAWRSARPWGSGQESRSRCTWRPGVSGCSPVGWVRR